MLVGLKEVLKVGEEKSVRLVLLIQQTLQV